MATKSLKSQQEKPTSDEDGDIEYETPWKLLLGFGILLLACVVYGFFT